MENFVLTPYSHWILWAGIALLIVFLIVTGIKCVPLIKAIGKMKKESIEPIQRNVTMTKIKTDTLKEVHEERKKKVQPLLASIPLLIAMVKNYKDDDEKKGAKGMRKAADEVLLNKANKEKIREYLRNLAG